MLITINRLLVIRDNVIYELRDTSNHVNVLYTILNNLDSSRESLFSGFPIKQNPNHSPKLVRYVE